MENYPVTHVIPRGRTLSEVYPAYDHSGSGHYNLVVQGTTVDSGTLSHEPSVHLTGVLPAASPNSSTKCFCGRGPVRKARENEFCTTYKSRCPWFRTFQSCNDFCCCHSCANPFGRNVRDTENLKPLPGKRAKQDFQQNVGQTDRGYMEERAVEANTPTWLEDEHLLFEAVTLYLLMTEHDVSLSFSIYHKIKLKTYQLSLRP